MSHPASPGFRPGEHWAECDRCGFEYYGSDLREEWTGLWVCDDCFETRHPQDFVRGKTDNIAADEPIRPAKETFRELNTAERQHDYIPASTFYVSGTEMFINPEFKGGGTGWLVSTEDNDTIDFINGKFVLNSAASGGTLFQPAGPASSLNGLADAPGTYTITIVVDSYSSGAITFNLPAGETQLTITAPGTYTFTVDAAQGNYPILFWDAGSTAIFDSFSIKKVVTTVGS